VKPHIVIYDAIFFSPHLDDAVLSQGGTIAKLTAEEKEVLVVTIFAQGESNPISGDGKNYLKKCGKTGVREMFIDRKKEDKNAGKVLGFDTLHLGYNAEIYRLRPKTLINSYFPYFRFIYPSLKKAFRGKISSADTTLQGRIKKDLKSIIKKYGKPGTKIYGPLGVGSHVDHLIVFEALNSLRIKNLFFWGDVPYSKQEKIKKRLKDLAKRKLRFAPQKVDINKHANLKKKAILQYTSQIPMLFPDGLVARAYETYYKKINKNSLVLTNTHSIRILDTRFRPNKDELAKPLLRKVPERSYDKVF